MDNKRSNPLLRAVQRADKLLDYVTDALAVTSGIFVIILTSLICVSVVLRYYFNLSVGWTTELTEYFIFIVVMLGTPWVLKNNKHVVVDVVYSTATPKLKRTFAIITNAIGFLVGAGYFYYGLQATHENFVKGTLLVKIMPIPKWLPLLFVPIMSFLVACLFARKTIEHLRPPSSDQELEERYS